MSAEKKTAGSEKKTAVSNDRKATVDKRSVSRTPARPSRAAAVSDAGGRLPRFLREVRVEMGKVTWPSRPDLLQSTMVVLVAIAIAATYIGVWDLVWSQLVNLARLG